MRKLESIRNFLTSSALTLLIDVVLTVVFFAVMFVYSSLLFWIVVETIPLYVGLSILVTRMLRRRLDEKFQCGAENQAFLVESVSGAETVKAIVAAAVAQATELLARLTSGVKETSLPAVSHMGSFSALPEILAFHEKYFKHAAELYMLPQRRKLEGIVKAQPTAVEYVRAKWDLELVRRKVDDAFIECDLVVLPTYRILPPSLSQLIESAQNPQPRDPMARSNCAPFDILGIPAVSIPCGFSAGGLPIGLMIAGPRFSEGKVLALAQAYERATEWHTRRPPILSNTPMRDDVRESIGE